MSRSQTKTGMRCMTGNTRDARHRYAMHFVMIDQNDDKLELLLLLISTLVSNGSIRLNQNAKMC